MAINSLALGTNNISAQLASKLDLAGGKILQIVRATDSTNRSTTSTSFVDVTGMSVTITPQKSDSAIIIIASFQSQGAYTSDGVRVHRVTLTDSSNNPISGAEDSQSGQVNYTGSATREFSSFTTLLGYSNPATTSATTYKLRQAVITAGTVQCRNASTTGQMYAIEVSA